MGYDFQTSRETRSRKPRVCECCQSAIPAGQRHTLAVGVWEGDFYHARLHSDCWAAREDFCDLLDPDGDGLQFDIGNALCEVGGVSDVQATLDAVRGKFPHVVARFEFRLRSWLDREAG